MGSILKARCPCGFDVPMMLGGGMRSHEELCAFPALCGACGGFQVVNLLSRSLRCLGCGGEKIVAYDDPSLAGTPGGSDFFSWNLARELGRSPRLSDGTYRCPKCGQTRLRFEATGFWD